MTALRLPSNWRTLSFPQKAAYLCTTRQARDYSHACSLLALRCRKKPRVMVAVRQEVAVQSFWWNRED